MTVRLEAFLLCDQLLRDSNGKFQIQGIFDTIWVESLPAIHREMFVYFRFYVDEPDISEAQGKQLQLGIYRPSGFEAVPPVTVKVNPQGRIEGFMGFRGFPITEVGPHRLILLFDGQEIGSYRLWCLEPGRETHEQRVH